MCDSEDIRRPVPHPDVRNQLYICISLTGLIAYQIVMVHPHPFDPITPGEIQLAVRILEAAFPGVKLRYKRIDLQEPTKHEVIPYIEAERLGKPCPRKPARLLMALYHRLDNGSFYKALLNADTESVVLAKELPKDVQVSYHSCTLWNN